MPISGEVAYNGKPVAEGSVVFLPRDASVGRQASGVIDAKGRFKLASPPLGLGVVPGDYDVIVLAFDSPPGEPTREELEALAGKPWRKPLVPERYTDVATTDLRETVSTDHAGTVRYELAD
ncbi:MAG: hypothetical protein ACRCT8_01770 [Lacipirellulaceae bacterium]